MIDIKSIAIAMALGVALVPALSDAETRSPVTTAIASYPHGAFLENLFVDAVGGLVFTSYIDRRLMHWTGTGEPETLATLDAHPVGVIVRAHDIIVSAHGLSFADGPKFTSTNKILVLDRKGSLLRTIDVPDAKFLNGLVELSADTVLVADSLAGRIWRFDPTKGTLSNWLADPALTVDAVAGGQRPGANGLKLRGGWLYVSNSSRRTISRVRVRGGRPVGSVETVAADLSVDDFAFLPDGSIVAATHGAKLLRRAGNGQVTDLLSEGCDACTSVAPYGLNGDLIVLTTGNLVEGGQAPARVLRVSTQ